MAVKPCPFCGSVNELHVGIKSGKVIWNMLDTRKLTYRRYYVRCHKCNARGPVVSGFVCDIIGGPRISEQKTVIVNEVDTVINTDEHYMILAWKKWNDTFAEDEQPAFCGELVEGGTDDAT